MRSLMLGGKMVTLQELGIFGRAIPRQPRTKLPSIKEMEMHRQHWIKFIFALVVTVRLTTASYSQAATPAEQLGGAVKEMNSWLGTSKAAQGWQKFLKVEQLQAELAKGSDADKALVAEVLAKFESKTAGLDKPQFTAVRTALSTWLTELKLPKQEELPALARDLKSKYASISDEQLAESKKQLQAAFDKLSKYLPPKSKNAAGWRTYLTLDELAAQLKAEGGPDLKSLVATYRLFTADVPGLERKEFTDVSDALLNYIDLVAVRGIADAEAQYDSQLDGLAESLEKYATAANEEENFNIGRRLGELTVGRQAGDLVSAVRRYHSHPNLLAEFSHPLVEAGLARAVNRDVDVNDNILGASIWGSGKMTGNVTVEFVPSSTHAVMETVLKGQVHTNTTGSKSGVTFYGRGVTSFHARKAIHMTDAGLVAKPARCNAVTNNHVYDLSAGPIVANAAWGQINANRAQGNYVAARHAETRISHSLDTEASPMLKKSAERFQTKFRNPLVRLREFPELFQFSTTADQLRLVGLKANRFQIGAPGEAPALKEKHDLAVRVHESFPGNIAAALLGGKTLTDEGLKKQIIAMRGELPEEMKNDEDQEPWSITFARHKPVTVLFTENELEVTIRGQQYTSGEREFRAMNVSAKYKMELTPTGSKMVRQGVVKIEPPDFALKARQLSASEVALKTILERKFGKLFKEEVVSDGLELPGGWEKIGKLRPTELVSSNGWITIGWSMPSKDQVAGGQAAKKNDEVKK